MIKSVLQNIKSCVLKNVALLFVSLICLDKKDLWYKIVLLLLSFFLNISSFLPILTFKNIHHTKQET